MIEIPRGSIEYVSVDVVAAVSLTGTVEISINDGSSVHTWLPATWQGSVGTSRTAQTTNPVTLSLANYPNAEYLVHVRITSGAQTPIVAAGTLKITA